MLPSKPLLGRLKDLQLDYLHGEEPALLSGRDSKYTFLYLPSLEKLQLSYGLTVENSWLRIFREQQHKSSVTELKIRGQINAPHIESLFHCFKALTTVDLRESDLGTEVMSGLSRHCTTLQHLTVLFGGEGPTGSPASFADFERLRTLCIYSKLIVDPYLVDGNPSPDPNLKAAQTLVHRLPESLQELYIGWNYRVPVANAERLSFAPLYYLACLLQQKHLPGLRRIALCGDYAQWPPDRRAQRYARDLEDKFAAARVELLFPDQSFMLGLSVGHELRGL
ncbi:uncharacterized protein BDZ99DRAFT_519037 [Mytilinidion resinicola]|uniref:F-box domain-containing protein n=1 Tax=Mytilinidion resinicola TaxID=574789 RepID=A0A6A6YSL4_9PEZI|nr:uncharacterized protein BDZ99DRAFT_519037 [Mytilinidion resinicola]KAF2811790.1 hypothetical protein BDZ99DRAFT_519037 [Mytilinidion resinicola]